MKALVALNRSGIIESIHLGLICISDTQNNVIANIGSPDTRIYLRSAAKPFQAIALVESGALERFGLTNEELALICTSHSGQDFHYPAVAHVLKELGIADEKILDRLALWAYPPVKDHKGEVVGSTVPVFSIANVRQGIQLGAEL